MPVILVTMVWASVIRLLTPLGMGRVAIGLGACCGFMMTVLVKKTVAERDCFAFFCLHWVVGGEGQIPPNGDVDFFGLLG